MQHQHQHQHRQQRVQQREQKQIIKDGRIHEGLVAMAQAQTQAQTLEQAQAQQQRSRQQPQQRQQRRHTVMVVGAPSKDADPPGQVWDALLIEFQYNSMKLPLFTVVL